MVLLMEQERLIASEKNLLNNANSYAAASPWGQIFDYGNITTAEDGIVICKFDVNAGVSSSGTIALFIGGFLVECYKATAQTVTTVGAAVWLPAGTYDVAAYGLLNTGASLYIQNVQVGFAKFNDVAAYALQASSSCTVVAPSSRNTPAGPLNQVMYCINATAYAPLNQLVGAITITVDGLARTNSEFAFGSRVATAKCYLPFAPGTSHTVSISSDNGSATLYLSVIACPWILGPSVHAPITPNFSQGSTLYCTVNALFTDSTKLVGTGGPRGVDWGAAYDYYSTSSGTGLIQFSSVWDTLDPAQGNLYTSGLGGCIEIVGADVR